MLNISTTKWGSWLIALALLLTIGTQTNTQAQSSPKLVCGTRDLTPAQQTALEKEVAFALRIKKASRVVAGITYVPIRPHIIRRSNGTGGLTLATMNQLLARTNRYFLTVNMQFFYCGTTPDYFDDDALFANYTGPDDMGNLNDEARFNGRDATDALNMYFINTTTEGYGAYAYRPNNTIRTTRQIIRADQPDAYLGDELTPHELGHTFNLIHTFGPNNGNGGLTEELVNGSNCTTKGDLLCDTPADPFGHPNASANGCIAYTGTVLDANGAAFSPSLNNLMSYWRACVPEFTPGQYGRIEGGLATRQGHNAYSLNCAPTAVTAPTNVFAYKQFSSSSSVSIRWQDNASNEMGYFIERATSSGGPFTPIGGVAPNIVSFTDFDATSGTTYYYRVRPSNSTTGGVSDAVTLDITGDTNLCNTANYSLNTPGGTPVSWAVTSGASSVSATSGTGNTLTLNALSTANNSYVVLEFTVNGGTPGEFKLQKVIYATFTPAPSMTTTAGQATVPAGQTAVSVQQFTGNVLFTAGNCAGGTINWSGGGNSGTNILVAPTTALGTIQYDITCTKSGCTGPVSNVRVTVTAGPQPLALVTPEFDCTTGKFKYKTIGGDNSPIEFRAIGISDWTTIADQTIASGLRNDATIAPFALFARQSGRTVQLAWDLRAFCNSPNLTPLLIDNPIPNLIATVGQLFQYTVPANTFRDPDGQPLTYSATGLPQGLNLTSGTISGIPSVTGIGYATITASDPGGRSIGTAFTITVLPQAGGAGTLQLLVPLYNCSTGELTFRTTGGNGTPIEFLSVGITNWSTTTTFTLPASLRTNPGLEPFTILARQGGTVISLVWDLRTACTVSMPNRPPTSTTIAAQIGTVGQAFSLNLSSFFTDPDGQVLTFSSSGLPTGLSISSLGVISGSPSSAGVTQVTISASDPFFQSTSQTFFFTVNPSVGPAQPLVLVAPLYDCNTGRFVFQTTGGNGTTIEFSAIGITNWTANANQTISPSLIGDYTIAPFALKARQSGIVVSYTWDIRTACSNLPPIIVRPTPLVSATVGQAFSFDVSSYFADPETLPLHFGNLLNAAPGLTLSPAGVISGTPTAAGNYTTDFYAIDVAGMFRQGFLSTVVVAGPVPPVPGSLQLLAPTYNCATGAFLFNATGNNGLPVEFQGIGITNWTSNAGPYTVRPSADVQPFTLKVRYVGNTASEVSFSWNYRTTCGLPRQGAESDAELDVRVLGNPVSGETVDIDVRGAEGQPLRVSATDASGRLVSQQQVEQAAAIEQHRLKVGRSAGIYLINVSTPTQNKTVRVLKID